MDIDIFKNSLNQKNPPEEITDPLKALWIEANGDWDTAHRIVQVRNDRDSMWVHAYLHRKEGDVGNSSYWYHRANMPMSTLSFDEEWHEIAIELLDLLKV